MIIIFGGTTEGRIAAQVADESGQPFLYSTKSQLQNIPLKNGKRCTGALKRAEMTTLIRQESIRLIIDAAHPFATHLHTTICHVAAETHTPVVRYERIYPPHEKDIFYCRDYQDAVCQLQAEGIHRLLALTGVNTIAPLRPYWHNPLHKTYFRILKREESIQKAEQAEFPAETLIYYDEEERLPLPDEEVECFRPLKVQAILTKESGESGGTEAKIEAARRLGLKIFVICRPQMPHPEGLCLTTVTGPHGLRRAIEKLYPEFFPLHTGFTTGSCATAAVHAAINQIIAPTSPKETHFLLPDGEEMTLPVYDTQTIDEHTAWAEVIKEAGSDPDVTDGCHIRAIVQLCIADQTSVSFLPGKGVGTVTLPGLGIPIGEPAINPVPRQMIEQDIKHWAHIYGHELNATITIEVDHGEELAKRTFNPRVGVINGISIIGTSGIVKPFSNEAFIESIAREVDVALAMKTERIVISSGAKSEATIKRLYPNLINQAFIHYGNFIGDTLNIIRSKTEEQNTQYVTVTLGMMLGKAAKLADGNLTTHSHLVTTNKEFLIQNAREAHCSEQTIETIRHTALTRTLWSALKPKERNLFMKQLLVHCRHTCKQVFPTERLTIILIGEDGSTFISQPDNSFVEPQE